MLAVVTAACTMLIRAKRRRTSARARMKRADNSDSPFVHLSRGDDSSEHSAEGHPFEREIRQLMEGDNPAGFTLMAVAAESFTHSLPLPLEYSPWVFVTTHEQLEVLILELSQVGVGCWHTVGCQAQESMTSPTTEGQGIRSGY